LKEEAAVLNAVSAWLHETAPLTEGKWCLTSKTLWNATS